MKSIKKLAVIMLSVMVLFGTLTVPTMAAAKSPTKKTFNTVSLKKKTTTYNGKIQKPVLTVKAGKTTLKAGKDYKVIYETGTNMKTAGKKIVIIQGLGKYAGCYKTATYTINPATQKNVKVSKSSVAVKKGKSTTIKLTKSKAAKATWKSSNSKAVKVNSAGKITVAKNAKKGTYTVKVTVKLANHKTVTKTVKVKVN